MDRLGTRFAWEILSVVVGLVGIALAIVSLRSPRSRIEFEVSELNVVEVHAQVPDLVVTLAGRSIDSRRLNLKLITLRIANTGDVDILKSHFDDALPWGFRTNQGRIVVSRVTGASSRYIFDGLSPICMGANRLQFKPILFDRGAYVTLEAVILYEKDRELHVVPEGKIAGVPAFEMTRSRRSAGQLMSSFSGDIVVQLQRLGGYGGALLLIFMTTYAAVTGAARRISRRRAVRVSDDPPGDPP